MKSTLIILACLVFQRLAAENFNIADSGAVPDGKTLCTAIIQKAIDDCSASGGGRVTIPTGKFLTGTLFLKDNVSLYLENGAVLLGSTRIEDYKPANVIKADHAQNISIAGDGTIDGQGSAFWLPADRSRIPYSRTPQWTHQPSRTGNLILLNGCRNVKIENVTLKGSESWTLHLLGCDDVMVHGITIRNPLHGPNTDGIDIQACSNVRISDCDIYTRDDAIVLKNRHPAYYGKPCENIVVTNCIITTECNGFKIGTESLNDFRNIVFSNSVIKAANLDDELAKVAAEYVHPGDVGGIAPISGIAIESVDGSHLQGVTVTNIVMDGVLTPVFIRLANRGAGEQKVAVPVPGTLKDVIISNIVAYRAKLASSITGIPGSCVENVMLENILISTEGGGDKELAGKELDEKIQAYPEARMWGPMPVSGFFVRHVKGLQMSDMKIEVDKNDMRPLIKFDDVADLYIRNLRTNDGHQGQGVLDFRNVTNANLSDIRFPETLSVPWFLFSGAETGKFIISVPGIKNLRSRIKQDPLVRKDAISY